MLPATSGGSSHAIALADEQATYRMMRDIAVALEPGDLITLSGDLGAGKTTFADLLVGLIEPQSGALRVDGAPLSGAVLAGWRDAHGSGLPIDEALLGLCVELRALFIVAWVAWLGADTPAQAARLAALASLVRSGQYRVPGTTEDGSPLRA